jgi:hypothetical protein
LGGVSARAFEDRSDAFQQLIGDGLLAMSRHSAHSYPTKREDGSIDSFLAIGAPLVPPFENLLLPAIIECKDHDDSLPRVGENILDGWGKVRSKLARQANEGWPNLFKPWREVSSYIYVVSAVIPSQDVRQTLEVRIHDFFANLEPDQRPPIGHILLLDWNDVRLWLNQFSDVRDSWLGTGALNIISLNQYRSGLSGFRRFLRSDELLYSPPAGNSTYHPEVLFDRLADPNVTTGILLVGAGGVGKTRTSYEVALLAEKFLWRVLYVLPADPPVTTEQLSAIVLAQHSAHTLVIFEYLDQMPHLDIGALRRSLIPRARAAGIHLACLANSRPGFVWKPHPERDALFTRVDLSLSTEEAQALSKWAVKRTAPNACLVLSDEEVFRVSGHRPIIALLVAQQLEKLAIAGTLSSETVQPIRAEDPLGHWLRRRLAEDELTTPAPKTFWDTARPEARVVAAASVLACAPDYVNGLFAAGAAVLKHLDSDFESRKIVQGLLELGWLEEDGPWLSAVHDVVADEVVEQTIFDGSIVRPLEFEAMLSVALRKARSFGRLSKALSRVQGATSADRVIELRMASRIWLERHAEEIGDAIADAAPTHGSYALGAVFGVSIFEDAAMDQWAAVVAPWLDKYDTDFEARHLLYRGLRAVSDDDVDRLIGIALSWLSRWRLEAAASFVITPLLHRDLRIDDSSKLITWAIEWLRSYGPKEEAKFVINALLNRKDLKEPEVDDAITLTMPWLESHGLKEGAQYVLGPLLSRKNLKGQEAEMAITYAVAWLNIYGATEGAQYVLSPLLGRKDIGEPEAYNGINHAMVWLDSYGTIETAGFVLEPLLNRNDIKEPDAASIFTKAKQWLDVYGTIEEGGFVLGAWLDAGGETLAVKDSVEGWLKNQDGNPEIDYLCKAWLDAGGDREIVRNSVEAWLHLHGAEWSASHIYKAWLDSGGEKNVVWDGMLDWLRKHRTDESAVYLTSFIAKQQNLPPNTVKDILVWCHTFPSHEEVMWRFTQLGRNLFVSGVTEDVIKTAETVLNSRTRPELQLKAVTCGQVTTLLSYLFQLSINSSGPNRDRVDTLFVAWLMHPLSFGSECKPHYIMQPSAFLNRLLLLLDAGFLEVDRDEEPLRRFMLWVDTWDAQYKRHASSILNEIRDRHPTGNLWNFSTP